ncbi:MAG: radical SAM protein, partial [Planctomycetes bacterium]|nr:radical SAM protein [Planctomycetota bacterium]
MIQGVLEKIKTKQRLTPAEGVALFGSFDLLSLGRAADERRRQYHPEPVVTYTVDRNINYTNVCVSGCRFCAFFRSDKHSEAYVISKKDLFNKIRETVDLGGSHILFQGGLHPDLKIDFYEDLLRSVKEKFNIHIHGFSPPEIIHFSRLNNLSLKSVLTRLKKAGLDTIPGGGAEILSDRLRRQVSPHKCTAAEWLEVMRQAHQTGMRTTATMM